MSVSLIARARGQDDEMTMKTLGYKGFFTGTDDRFLLDLAAGNGQQFFEVAPNHPGRLGQALAAHIVERIGNALDGSNKDSRF
jgi:hypothetical protein